MSRVTPVQPIQCSAPEYVDYLMTWVQHQLVKFLNFIFEQKVQLATQFTKKMTKIITMALTFENMFQDDEAVFPSELGVYL